MQAPAEAIPRVVAAIEALAHADPKVTVEPGVVGATPGSQRSLEPHLWAWIGPGSCGTSLASWRDTAPTSGPVTDVSSAPMSGEPLFRAHMRLTVPAAADLDPLRTDLERFATDLMVELQLVETVTKTSVRSRHGGGAVRWVSRGRFGPATVGSTFSLTPVSGRRQSLAEVIPARHLVIFRPCRLPKMSH